MRRTRQLELFACETVRDADTGLVLSVDHGLLVAQELDPPEPKGAQASFDEYIEDAMFWHHHLANGDSYAEEDDDEAERDW